MRIKNKFKYRLIFSYVLIILIAFAFAAFLLDKSLQEMSSPTEIKQSILWSFLFALSLAFVLGSIFTEAMTKPIKKMIKISQKLSAGDFTQKIHCDSEDEIGQLGIALNKMAQDIKEKIEAIKKLETMRRDFVANVSHELKTPLTLINGYTETLLDGAIEDKTNSREFLKIIQEHSQRLNSLINDLLELSCLEGKEIRLDKQAINIQALVDKICLTFQSRAKIDNIIIENNLENNLMLNVDKSRIQQVFINLIDNAIKFNKENGYIKIYSQNYDDKIKIIVEDSGIGISEKDIPRIFERFYRVDKARSRELGGTGLGLSIVKHIIELHGGSVGVESAEGLGSKFYFSLPK